MCGRFTLRTHADSLAEVFALDATPSWEPRFNIAPTQLVAATIRMSGEQSPEFQALRWGLIPSWAKDPAIGNRMINARAETVAEKPAFRTAFRRRRCLVLADGYFEWEKRGGYKQPFYFRLLGDRPFAFAGLWESWRSGDSEETLRTCTIITTHANEATRPIHDRMPVILDEADYERWLDPDQQEKEVLLPLLRPYTTETLRIDPVDRCVNSPRRDAPDCIRVIRELF